MPRRARNPLWRALTGDRSLLPLRPPEPLFDPTAPPTSVVPGLVLVGALTAIAIAINAAASTISSLLLGVLLGALVGNLGLVPVRLQPGFRFAARRVLRFGIVLLGLRLSLSDVADLGAVTILVVVVTVIATFFGTQALGVRLGLSRDLSLLIATGYSICGASAIVAVEGSTDATEDEVAVSIGLVTLCGTLAILSIPPLGDLLGLTDRQLGTWIGAGIHDVGQVAAAGSIAGTAVLGVAVVVKLTRVSLLAAIVTWVNLNRRDTTDDTERRPILPLFVIGFLTLVLVRTSGVLGDDIVDAVKEIEGVLLTAALVGLGAGVQAKRLRALGAAPLLVGLLAWVLVAGVSLAATLALI